MKTQGLSVGQPTSDFLGNLAPKDREALTGLGHHREYLKAAPIFRVGDPGAHVYFLESGRVKIYQPSGSGREVILWFCLTGEIFGLAEVARGGGRIVGALACEDSMVLVVSQDAFKEFVVSRPEAGLLSMQVLSSRLRGLSDVLVNLVSDEVDIRIAKLILRLGARYGRREGGVVHLDIPLTHQEIADMVGTTRQTVTGVLSRLKRQGVLSIDTHRIHIESEELLTGLAQ
jgi:CRP/FNR family transcriptional regulator, cyclic AMP receptor protein